MKTSKYIINTQKTDIGDIPVVQADLSFKDHLGSLFMRLNIGRSKYKIEPGVYSIGNPDKSSPVLVTANYKLTFDSLRKELVDLNTWILVLDTKGINVWCAAGKGTFGTEELIQRIQITGIMDIIDHNILILPQLGAPGISAHKVKELTGTTIKYGPVRAADIKEYINNNYIATKEMRQVKFDLKDRVILTPVEMSIVLPAALIIIILIVLLKLFDVIDLIAYILPFAGAVFVGTVLTPVLLPVVPFRAFSLKGGTLGSIWAILYVILIADLANIILSLLTYLLLLSPISAFLALNFTGASTYASPSGVKKEIKTGIPIMIVSAAFGLVLLILQITEII